MNVCCTVVSRVLTAPVVNNCTAARRLQGMMAMVQPTGMSLLSSAWKMLRGGGDNKEQNPQSVSAV